MWGPQVEGFMEEQASGEFYSPLDIMVLLEHRLGMEGLHHAAKRDRSWGYRVVAVPAKLKVQEFSGGGVILARRSIMAVPVCGYPCLLGDAPDLGHGDDWTAIQVNLKHGHILVIDVYLTAGIGIRDRNVSKMFEIKRFLDQFTFSGVLLGDFNATPNEMHESGILNVCFTDTRHVDPGARLGVDVQYWVEEGPGLHHTVPKSVAPDWVFV